MSTERIAYLLEQYLQGKASAEETEELAALVRNEQHAEALSQQLALKIDTVQEPAWKGERWEEMVQQVLNADRPGNAGITQPLLIPIYRRNWFRYTAAAVFLLMLTGTYFLVTTTARQQPVVMVKKSDPANIAPGRQGAILTLADGKQVVLDSLGNGVVAMQGKTTVLIKGGQLVYNAPAVGQLLYNTMVTPRGRIFNIMLPDGTHVWLNAASSITFPTVFEARERRVKITGEAYFEVAKDNTKPFLVQAGETEVRVLGTHFNVNAYADEAAINTTLLEGSVRISSKGQEVKLQPGQQAQVKQTIQLIPHADTEQALAWKNGKFSFQDKSAEEVMRLISRWYDIEVEFEQKLPDLEFWGGMYRDVPLSAVLQFLGESGLQFRLSNDGKKLMVTNIKSAA